MIFNQLRRAAADATNATGMQAGMPKVRVYASEVQQLLERYDSLEAENAELQKDRKRLEWCASAQVEFYHDEPDWIIRWLGPTDYWRAEQESVMASNWRAAVDEAMSISQER